MIRGNDFEAAGTLVLLWPLRQGRCTGVNAQSNQRQKSAG